jgi:glycosyltransferase involved in cell wall biosynthesis
MEKSKKPLVSFVIRTKNEGKFIGKVLHLIYKQTFQNFEVVIVDSASTDRTLEIVDKFPVKLIKIKPEEFGMSYALNLGISKARGKYICIISGHSIPLSNTWLEKGLQHFKDEKIAAVTGHYTSFPLGYFSRPLGRIFFLPFVKTEINTPWMTNTNAMIRKDLWRKYPFDEKLSGSEDYDWASEMIARGYRVVKDKEFSVFHSHFLLGRPGYWERLPGWKKISARIDKRKRPRSSYTSLKI